MNSVLILESRECNLSFISAELEHYNAKYLKPDATYVNNKLCFPISFLQLLSCLSNYQDGCQISEPYH